MVAKSIVLGLSGVGLYIAAYFTLVYYGLVAANTKLMPRVCQLEERTCQTVLTTKFARLFGVPNSLLGVIYYFAVILFVATGWIDSAGGLVIGSVGVEFWLLAAAASWFAVAIGFVLVYALFFIIHIPCPLCMAGHSINLALALTITFLLR